MAWLRQLLLLVRVLVEDRQRLALENVALRHQLAVLKRSVKRAKIQDSDRMFWILMTKMLKDWKETVHFVKPDTVVRWHRNGFRFYWRKKSKGKPGRPPISMAIIHLIRRMSMDNVTWGAPMIVSELALLGHTIEIWSIAVDENLERSRGDLGAVLELDSSDDVSEELVSI